MEDVGSGPVALDTALFIYWMEDHPAYAPILAPLFSAIEGSRLKGVTSAVTLLETLVLPYRHGEIALAQLYEAFLTASPGLVLCPLDLPLLKLGAEIRAVTGVRTPDALQLAAAASQGCPIFVTNDKRLPEQLTEIRLLQLSRYLGNGAVRSDD